MTLGRKLVLLSLAIVLLPLILASSLAFNRSSQALEEATRTRLVSTTLLKQAEFNRWVEGNARSLRELARRPQVRQYSAELVAVEDVIASHDLPAHQALHADHLDVAIAEEGRFLELFILRPADGIILISTNRDEAGKYRDDQPYFLEGLKGTYVQNSYYLQSRDQVVMTIATPILDPQGQLIAVLAGYLDMAEVSTILAQGQELSESEETYLVDRFNFFVTEGRFNRGLALGRTVQTQGVADCLAGNDGVGPYEDYRGVAVLGAYQWIDERDLCILTEIDQSEVLAHIADLRNAILLVSLVGAAVVAGLSLLFSRTITRSLDELVIGAQQIGQGNLVYRLPTHRKDEVGQLASSFNAMALNLQAEAEENARLLDQMRRSEARFRSVSEEISDGVAVTIDGRNYWMNPAFTQIFGYSQEELLGKTIDFLVVPEEVPLLLERMKQRAADGDVESHSETIARRKNGALIHIDVSAKRIEFEEKPAIQLVVRDISERKQMQERLMRSERLAILGQLTGGIGHELRNPLGAIKNASYFLGMAIDEPSPDIRDTLEILERQVDACERIIASLLSFTRPRPPEPMPARMEDILREVLNMQDIPAEIDVEVHCDTDLGLVLLDPGQMSIVLSNLVRNAVQAMPDGGHLTISASAISDSSPTRRIRISVADNGFGISTEQLPHLFEPLFTTKSSGIGLGLALTKLLVEGHGGEITASSTPGVGTTFAVNLPQESIDESGW